MDIISKVSQLGITATFAFLTVNSGAVEAEQGSPLQEYKTQKPLVLEIRYCSCKAGDIESDTMAPTSQFLEEAHSMKVGTLESDIGFVSSGGMTFGYSIAPDSDSDSFILAYSEEYTQGRESFSSQADILIDLNSWVIISGYQDISNQGSKYFNVAVRLFVSTEN